MHWSSSRRRPKSSVASEVRATSIPLHASSPNRNPTTSFHRIRFYAPSLLCAASASGAPTHRPSRHVRQRSLSTSEIPDAVKRGVMRMKAEQELRETEEAYVRDLEFVKKVRPHSLCDVSNVDASVRMLMRQCVCMCLSE